MTVLAPTLAELTWDATVPRGLVHRRAVAEVLVTSSVQLAPHEFGVGVQLSRSSLLWSDRPPGHHDPLGLLEAGRQATFVIVHRYYGVPQHGTSFVSRDLRFRVLDLAALADGGEPLDGAFHVHLHDTRKLDRLLVGLSFRAELLAGGRPAMEVAGSLVFMPSADYGALRGAAAAKDRRAPEVEPLPPAAVDRAVVRNVVVGAGTDRLPVVVDTGHPAFFDHPQDHLPGPFIAEVFRQASLVAVRRLPGAPAGPLLPVRAEAEFTDFAEPDQPVEVTAEATGSGPWVVRTGLHQAGRQVVAAEMELAAPP